MSRHIFIIASHAPTLINLRGRLLMSLISAGWRVTAAVPDVDASMRRCLEEMGVAVVETALARTSLHPLDDFRYFRSLLELCQRLSPDVILSYTIKPVIWGTLAARVARVPRVVTMITGLGYAFTQPEKGDWKHRATALLVSLLYRVALPRADFVLFQNPDDRDLFMRRGFTPRPECVEVIAGSGVDLTHYSPSPPPPRPSFLMLARLLKAKGVREYATAARSLRRRYPDVEFRLAGPLYSSPDAITRADLDHAIEGGVTYLGALEDVRSALAEAAVYVLPSHYREGTPRSTLEALATGRAIVTTDAPGCRETVVDGVNGFLVPPRDAVALEQALERFVKEPDLIPAMGRASSELAREKYDVDAVNGRIIAALSPR